MADPSPDPGPARPLSRKRTQTRERLLAAALDVFAERGVNGAAIEDICEGAGLTRGAYYSNYSSRDELLLALYDQQSSRLLSALADAVAEQAVSAGDLTLEQLVVAVLRAVPQDRSWFLVNSEFVLHAVRHPAAGAALVAQRARVRRGVEEVLRAGMAQLGLESSVELSVVVRWLVALHEGALNQAYLEPESFEPESLAIAAAPVLVTAVSRPAGSSPAPPGRRRRRD